MEKIKILLDTDIGQDIDDALTLSYLLCNPRCELMGITTVSGVVDERAQMASAICRSVGRDDIPIYPGFNECIFVEPRLVSVPQIGMVSNWSHRTEFPKKTRLFSLCSVQFAKIPEKSYYWESVLWEISDVFSCLIRNYLVFSREFT